MTLVRRSQVTASSGSAPRTVKRRSSDRPLPREAFFDDETFDGSVVLEAGRDLEGAPVGAVRLGAVRFTVESLPLRLEPASEAPLDLPASTVDCAMCVPPNVAVGEGTRPVAGARPSVLKIRAPRNPDPSPPKRGLKASRVTRNSVTSVQCRAPSRRRHRH